MKFLLSLIFFFSLATSAAAQQEQDTVFIYFDFDKAVLTPTAKTELDKFISDYKNSSHTSPLLLRGHCDYVGSHAYNELLSKRRTFSVHNYLLNNGIPKTSVALVAALGEREPRNTNSTPEERALNRRVEIIRTKGNRTSTTITEEPMPPPVVAKTLKDTITDFSRQAIDTVKVGQTLRLRNINFYGGRHTFLPQSEPALQELLQVMKDNPTLEIEIQGHICCNYGSGRDGLDYDAGDDKLSVNRARAVYYFLANNGINKKRMRYRGFAATVPLVFPEYTEEDRTANRRVEIKILKR